MKYYLFRSFLRPEMPTCPTEVLVDPLPVPAASTNLVHFFGDISSPFFKEVIAPLAILFYL